MIPANIHTFVACVLGSQVQEPSPTSDVRTSPIANFALRALHRSFPAQLVEDLLRVRHGQMFTGAIIAIHVDGARYTVASLVTL